MSDPSQSSVVLVTGAGQGIGKGIARALLEAGQRVVLAELDEEAGRRTELEYRAVGPCRFVRTDVSDEASVANAVAQTLEVFGRLDGLVNNAGIANPASGPVEGLSLSDWNRVITTNLSGAFLCSKHAAAELRRQRGAIVNISSTRALQSERNSEAYAAAKGGVVALTHALAISLGPEVRINCISPGWIDVSAWRKQPAAPSLREEDHAQHPVGRVGKPEDIGNLALFLLGPAAGFITGQNFVVDGGMTRKMIYEE